MRSTSVSSRAWARVTGSISTMSPTCEEVFSSSLRNERFFSENRRVNRRLMNTVTGTHSR